MIYMQNNHAQWHVERSSFKKVNSINKERNEELTAKVDVLITLIKGKVEAKFMSSPILRSTM
jgi:hypothetical protein